MEENQDGMEDQEDVLSKQTRETGWKVVLIEKEVQSRIP